MFAEEKLRVSAVPRSISRFLSVAAVALDLPKSYVVVQEQIRRLEKFRVTRKIPATIRAGSLSQSRNGSGFRHLAVRPFPMSQLGRYLAAQTNTLSALSWLWCSRPFRLDRGDCSHIGRPRF